MNGESKVFYNNTGAINSGTDWSNISWNPSVSRAQFTYIVWTGTIWLGLWYSLFGGPISALDISSDGLTWTTVPGSSSFFNSVSSDGGYGAAGTPYGLVIVGVNASPVQTIYVSTNNGSTWNPITSGGFDRAGYNVETDGKIVIAVGEDTRANYSIQYTSENLLSWSPVTSVPTGFVGSDIKWNGSYWVAVGQAGAVLNTILKSTDGLTWTAAASGGFSVYGYSIDWNGSIWLAVGNDPSKPIQWSSDGTNWNTSSYGLGFGTNFFVGRWTGSYWLAGGIGPTGFVIKSADGKSGWTDVTPPGVSNQVRTIAVYNSPWNNPRPTTTQDAITRLADVLSERLNIKF